MGALFTVLINPRLGLNVVYQRQELLLSVPTL